MRGLLLTGTAATIVALRTTVRDRRARLWLVIVDAWARTVLASTECPEALRPLLRQLVRVFDRTLERARFEGDAVDVQRARAWRDALSVDQGQLTTSGAATVLWAAVSAWDDAAAEQRGRRERGGVPWEAYARAAQAVVEAIDADTTTGTARSAMGLRERMDAVEARLWGRAPMGSTTANEGLCNG
jgi:hypothetical protein